MSDLKVDNLLYISWCDNRWAPGLNANNILDYFTERSNPFYSRECNNEFIKMQQNARIDQLQHMQGIEYMLLHAQDPILYIIRKQQRYSPTQVNPLSCYHIIAGQVFQTPDLGSVINSRLVSAINHINGSFTELQSFSQYHPSKGYWWQTQKTPSDASSDTPKKNTDSKVSGKEEVASIFQRRRVDLLLTDLSNKFPYKPQSQPTTGSSLPSMTVPNQPSSIGQQNSDATKTDEQHKSEGGKNESKPDIKTEPDQKIDTNNVSLQRTTNTGPKLPPEKRQKLGS